MRLPIPIHVHVQPSTHTHTHTHTCFKMAIESICKNSLVFSDSWPATIFEGFARTSSPDVNARKESYSYYKKKLLAVLLVDLRSGWPHAFLSSPINFHTVHVRHAWKMAITNRYMSHSTHMWLTKCVHCFLQE